MLRWGSPLLHVLRAVPRNHWLCQHWGRESQAHWGFFKGIFKKNRKHDWSDAPLKAQMLPKDNCMAHSKTCTIFCVKTLPKSFPWSPWTPGCCTWAQLQGKEIQSYVSSLLHALIKIKVITRAVRGLKYCAWIQIQELGLGNLQEAAVGNFKHNSYLPKFRLMTELCLETRIMNI